MSQDLIREQHIIIHIQKILKTKTNEVSYIASITDDDITFTSSSSSPKTALTGLIDEVFSRRDALAHVGDELLLSEHGQKHKHIAKRFYDFFSK